MKPLLSAVALLLVVSSAHGQPPDRETRARQLYEEGKSAYNKADYQVAYDRFWESFQLSHVPALLYNVASALQGLKRPHDAAEALRSYLRLRPDDPDKPQIEERIAALEEEQRLLIAEQQKAPPPTPVPTPAVTAPVASPLVAPPPPEKPRKRTALIVGLTIGAAVVVGVAVGVGVAFAPQQSQSYTPSPTVGGPIRSTQ